MLQSTFLITLLAGSVLAAPLAEGSVKTTSECSSLSASSTPIKEGYGPTLASQPVYSAPPTPGIPTSASITPSITVAPPVPSASVPANRDQPAFSMSYSFSWSKAWNPALFSLELAFTETIATPLMSLMPVYPTIPVSMPTGLPGLPTIPLVETSCTEEEAQKTHTPLDTTRSAGIYPTGADSPASYSYPIGTAVHPTGLPRPSGTGRPDEYNGEGYGYGRPRPSDKWPSKYQPKGGFHAKKPVPSSTTCTGGSKANSTMKTSVRPTLTAGGY